MGGTSATNGIARPSQVAIAMTIVVHPNYPFDFKGDGWQGQSMYCIRYQRIRGCRRAGSPDHQMTCIGLGVRDPAFAVIKTPP